jgi:sec-independent protein translocase protein TatA
LDQPWSIILNVELKLNIAKKSPLIGVFFVHNTSGIAIRTKIMNIFGIGLPEMALIMVVALLVFGPKKLPEIGRSLGKAIRGFQEASKEFETEFKREAQQLEESITMNAKLESAKQIDNAEKPEAENSTAVSER